MTTTTPGPEGVQTDFVQVTRTTLKNWQWKLQRHLKRGHQCDLTNAATGVVDSIGTHLTAAPAGLSSATIAMLEECLADKQCPTNTPEVVRAALVELRRLSASAAPAGLSEGDATELAHWRNLSAAFIANMAPDGFRGDAPPLWPNAEWPQDVAMIAFALTRLSASAAPDVVDAVTFVGEVERVGTDEATGQPRVLIHGERMEIRGAAMCVCRGKYRFTAVPLPPAPGTQEGRNGL